MVVEGEGAEEFAGGGVDDADVAVVDEREDGGSGVGSSDADVVESAVVAEGDDAAGVDAVAADALAGVGGGGSGLGFGESLVGDGGGDAVEGSVGAGGVVEVDEAVELVQLWRDPAFVPTCRGCLRILESWFPAADTPSGVWLLASVVAEEVTRFSSTYVTGVSVEHVEATRAAIRKVLRSNGFRFSTRVVDGVVQVWSDDAYDALDPSEIRTSVTSALERIATGVDAAPQRDPDATPRPVDWHTWVIE